MFTCPWPGARQLYLITDTRELKPLYHDLSQYMKSSGVLRTPLGFLRVFFMRSALVITNNPVYAMSYPADSRSNWMRYGKRRGVPSPNWLVPTRNPEALRAALEEVPGTPRVQDHLCPPGPPSSSRLIRFDILRAAFPMNEAPLR